MFSFFKFFSGFYRLTVKGHGKERFLNLCSRQRILIWNMERKKQVILNTAKGLEHLSGVEGAVITCNHFNPMDSFIMQRVFDDSGHAKKMYRVIREGNYTSFPGFYGFLMRNCNTLPLSSNHQTLKKFTEATKKLLNDGNFVLVYPEQSMWWNYRKPKPLKAGAFTFAAKCNVPVLPCFITMRDSDIMGEDGFYVQEYTIHIGEPIYPDEKLPYLRRAGDMMARNAEVWKEIYEREYQIPLTYLTETEGRTS